MEVVEMFCILIIGVVLQIYEYTTAQVTEFYTLSGIKFLYISYASVKLIFKIRYSAMINFILLFPIASKGI